MPALPRGPGCTWHLSVLLLSPRDRQHLFSRHPGGVSQLCHSSKALLHPPQSQQGWKEGSCAATAPCQPFTQHPHKPFPPVSVSPISSGPLHPQRANLPTRCPRSTPGAPSGVK